MLKLWKDQINSARWKEGDQMDGKEEEEGDSGRRSEGSLCDSEIAVDFLQSVRFRARKWLPEPSVFVCGVGAAHAALLHVVVFFIC